MLDQKLKQISLDYATKMYDNIIRAFHSPLVKLEGEEANIFQYFNDWGFFNDLKIDDKNNKEATIKFLAMHKYKILSTVQKPKRSKWEVVTGRQLKK
jgi:hypothetical protein